MQEPNRDKFIEEVKALLSGTIADKNTVNYIAIKIEKLHEKYMEQYLTDLGVDRKD